MEKRTGKVIRGFWDCPYCKSKHIDGLIDKCPNCGSGKPLDIKYYMDSAEDTVGDEELESAGIGKDENDGQHKEWLCPYCGQLNNWRDKTCVSCGGPRDASDKEYGDKKDDITPEQAQEQAMDPYRSGSRRSASPKALIAVLAVIIILMVVMFAPLVHKSETVTGYDWTRTVTVETLTTYHESGWSQPSGAYNVTGQREFYGYEQVIDHYETVAVQRAKTVLAGYDTEITYQDNGNGTFSEIEHQIPRYVTEYYTEYVQQPVYREDPVYATKYYYDIDRWVETATYRSSGNDHDPYWSSEYTLGDNQRDTIRTEYYDIVLTDDSGKTRTLQKSFPEWSSIDPGKQYTVTKSLTGIVYKSEEAD
ncbi:MAG: hypothetical protein K5637_04990 [Lachnospiraceae bacterium]|nr:hypothetical protein [Lachnospiraceae bacterium]